MIRYNIIKNITLKFELEETAVENFIDTITDKMIDAFRKGKGVNIPEFGKFFIIPKTVNGVKLNTVSFSPSRKFADSVNDDFSDLVPEIIAAGSLKVNNEIRIAEVPYEIEGTDFTYYVFDEEEIREPDEIITDALPEKPQETVAIPESERAGTEEFDLTVEEEQVTKGVKISDEQEQQTDIEKTGPVTPETQTVSEKPGYFDFGDVPAPPESGLTVPESEQDYFVNENIVTEEHQVLPEPELLIADEDGDLIFPGDSFVDNINEEENKILLEAETAEKEPYDMQISSVITQSAAEDISDTGFETAGKKLLYPDELKDDSVTDSIESEILDLLKTREHLIMSLNLLDGVAAPKEDTLPEIRETFVEEEKVPEAGPEEEISEEIHPGEKDVSPAEDIIIPAAEEPETEKPSADEILHEFPSETEDKKGFDSETGEIQPADETIGELISETEIDEAVKKRIDELEHLARMREELQKGILQDSDNIEMQVFEKLMDESEPEPGISEVETIIIHEPEEPEPASLTDALQEVGYKDSVRQADSFEEIKDDNVKSYDDVFDTTEQQVLPQFSPEEGKKITPRSFLKFFLYLFFIFLLATFSFYVYKKILMVPGTQSHVDTTGTAISDSLKSLLADVDSAEMQETGISMLEDIEVEREGDIIYRKMNDEYRIQISVFQNLADAEKFIMNLKEKNFDAKIERADMPMGKTEYRIVVGTFSTLDEAKSYYNSRSLILNFIKVITPANSGLYLM